MLHPACGWPLALGSHADSSSAPLPPPLQPPILRYIFLPVRPTNPHVSSGNANRKQPHTVQIPEMVNGRLVRWVSREVGGSRLKPV